MTIDHSSHDLDLHPTTTPPRLVSLEVSDEADPANGAVLGLADEDSQFPDRAMRRMSRRLRLSEVHDLEPCTAITYERRDGVLLVRKSASEPDAQRRLEHELDVLSQLQIPAVVSLADPTQVQQLDDSSSPTALVTAFAGRTTLAQLVPDRAATVSKVGAALLISLTELHRHGWSHGSVSADHAIMGAGTVVLCSLGNARRSDGRLGAIDDDARNAAAVLESLAGSLPPAADRAERAARRALRSTIQRIQRDGSAALLDASQRLTDAAQQSALSHTSSGRTSGQTPTTANSTAGRRLSTPAAAVPSRIRALTLSVGTLAGFVAVILGLRWLGGPLQWPAADPLTGAIDPITLVLTAGRVAGVLAAIYGIVLSAATAIAVLTGRAEVAAAAARLASPRVRTAMLVLVGVGTVASAISGPIATPPTSSVASSAPARVAPVAAAEPTTAAPTTATPTTATPTTAAPTTAAPTSQVDSTPAQAAPDADADNTAADNAGDVIDDDSRWTVARGDHLWGISAQIVTDHLGGPATDADIGRYWSHLVDANRSNLVDPDNPDLLHVGQVLRVPSAADVFQTP